MTFRVKPKEDKIRFGGPAALKISITTQWGQSRHRPPENLVNKFVNKNL